MESESNIVYDCFQETSARVTNHSIRRKVPTTTQDQLSHCAIINLQFSLKKMNYNCVSVDGRQDYVELLGEIELEPLILDTFTLTHQQLMAPSSIHETIKNVLMVRWPLYWHDWMTGQGLCIARNKVQSVSLTGNDVMDVSIEFIFKHKHIFPRSYVNNFMSSQIDYGMVPATDSSIESLKKNEIIIDGSINCDQTCPICFEEFSAGGDKVVSMPCSHEFHGGCIEKWLKISHYCPICRYEMPTELDNVNDQ